MNDHEFRQLLDRLSLSWQGYAKVRKSVKKRICRHMQKCGYQTMEDYLRALDNPEILTEVEYLLCVSISHFFRDQYLWKILEEEILPDIIRRYHERINVWSAGCALGQEVYSFAILWDTLKNRFDRLPRLLIHATDRNPGYLEKAGEGAYRSSILKGVSGEIRERYLRVSGDGSNYLFADYLKKDITWQLHDLMKQPPLAGMFQIIFLRNNLLTYYREESRIPVFLKIVDSLDEGGFLIIGCHEKLPFQSRMLSQCKKCTCIFQKTHNTIPRLLE
ncbi:MAG TPA: hypothetical protein DDY17_02940 [Syntrophaceae bacterium]|nr:hypothetical protein [Syntrophaceae bacterium]